MNNGNWKAKKHKQRGSPLEDYYEVGRSKQCDDAI